MYYQDIIKENKVDIFPIEFPNQNIILKGNLYKPKNTELKKFPSIIVGHPAGGVKEQTAGVYAVKLAECGYLTLTFDAGYQGESTGEPRYLENPYSRVEDFRCAVDYLETRDDVDKDRIGICGMCAAGGYVIKAAETDLRMKVITTVSMADLGDMFRNGLERKMTPEIRKGLFTQICEQRTKEARGEPILYSNYVPKSEKECENKENDYKEAYDYYRVSPAKHPRSVNKFIFSRMDAIINFTALDHVELLERPLLVIAGNKANTKYFAEEAYKKAKQPKEIHFVDGATHIDLYFKKDYVLESVKKLNEFYKKYL